jgi:hypothetical protein
MRIKNLLPLLALLFWFSATAIAQSVVVAPKKVTYKRTKPASDYKKTFTITYPKVKAANAALSRKIERALSFERNFEFTVREEMGEIQWLEEADYEVLYNKNGILTARLFITGSGAYPSSSLKYVVVDLLTGNKVLPANIFTDLAGLSARVKKLQKADVQKGLEEIKKDPDYSSESEDRLFASTDFTAADLAEFSVGENGVTFHYDYGFPHVIRALEPDGDYLLTWKEIKPYIKPAGLLGKFIR